MIYLSVASIIILTTFVFLFSKLTKMKVCSICAGVSLTWIGLLVLRSFGYEVDPVLVGALVGGSVVGIAYKSEPYLRPNFSALLWKTSFISFGFGVAYFIGLGSWASAIPFFLACLLVVIIFLTPPKRAREVKSEAVQELEEKMKNCC